MIRAAVRAPTEPSTGRSPPTAAKPVVDDQRQVHRRHDGHGVHRAGAARWPRKTCRSRSPAPCGICISWTVVIASRRRQAPRPSAAAPGSGGPSAWRRPSDCSFVAGALREPPGGRALASSRSTPASVGDVPRPRSRRGSPARRARPSRKIASGTSPADRVELGQGRVLAVDPNASRRSPEHHDDALGGTRARAPARWPAVLPPRSAASTSAFAERGAGRGEVHVACR